HAEDELERLAEHVVVLDDRDADRHHAGTSASSQSAMRSPSAGPRPQMTSCPDSTWRTSPLGTTSRNRPRSSSCPAARSGGGVAATNNTPRSSSSSASVAGASYISYPRTIASSPSASNGGNTSPSSY